MRRDLFATARVIDCRIHQYAYEWNWQRSRASYFSVAYRRPKLPSWISSRSWDGWRATWRAMKTTRRRFALTSWLRVSTNDRWMRNASRTRDEQFAQGIRRPRRLTRAFSITDRFASFTRRSRVGSRNVRLAHRSRPSRHSFLSARWSWSEHPRRVISPAISSRRVTDSAAFARCLWNFFSEMPPIMKTLSAGFSPRSTWRARRAAGIQSEGMPHAAVRKAARRRAMRTASRRSSSTVSRGVRVASTRYRRIGSEEAVTSRDCSTGASVSDGPRSTFSLIRTL